MHTHIFEFFSQHEIILYVLFDNLAVSVHNLHFTGRYSSYLLHRPHSDFPS